MHPIARVSTNICRNLRTQQMSVLVLLCIFTLHVSAPIGGHLQVVCNTKIQSQLLYMSTDPLLHTYKGKCRSRVSFNNLRAIKYKYKM
jgi:hypothetical protein